VSHDGVRNGAKVMVEQLRHEGDPLSPMTRTSTSDEAALHIRRMIFNGELTPSSRVPQDDIAQALGISRIPVREALIRLERDGVVRIEMYRGAFVTAINSETICDHYQLYGLAFGFAAQRAIERSDHRHLATSLKAILTQLRKTVDPAEFTCLARSFNSTVVKASRSTRTEVMLHSLSHIVPGDFFTLVPEAMNIDRRGLPRVATAIGAGDSDGAATEYRKVMHKIGDAVIDVFTARGLIAKVQPTNPAADRTTQTVSRQGARERSP
jgi:DNA-binding GntR family transcriptional regulator